MRNKIDQKLDHLNQRWREIRNKLFQPLIKIFHHWKIRANYLSFAKIIFTTIYLILIQTNFGWAILFLVLGMAIDFIDGPLARYNGRANDRGKFIDMFSDQIVYVLFIWGLMLIQIGNALSLTYHIIIISAFYLIISIYKNEDEPTDWIIKPIARSTYYKLGFEIIALLYLFFKINPLQLDRAVIILNALITIHFIYYFIQFINKKL